MNIQTNYYTPSFEAKMDYSKIKTFQNRWKKISNLYETKTSEYDKLTMNFYPFKDSFSILFQKKGNKWYNTTEIGRISRGNMSKLLKDNSDNTIADFFAKLTDINVKFRKFLEIHDTFERHINNYNKKIHFIDDLEYTNSEIASLFIEKLSESVTELSKKLPLYKKFIDG